MSGEQFLRAHGWKLGGGRWFHDRLLGMGHSMEAAIQQQAQWLSDALKHIRTIVDDYGDDVPEKAITRIKLALAQADT
jgi:hypothetical protein